VLPCTALDAACCVCGLPGWLAALISAAALVAGTAGGVLAVPGSTGVLDGLALDLAALGWIGLDWIGFDWIEEEGSCDCASSEEE
jgi:hypothetical protein